MIYGIGVDLVNIARIGKAIEKWGQRFLDRVYTAQEIELSIQRSRSVAAFALRFAAKEAFSKAIGLGMRKGVRWRDVELIHNQNGRPVLKIFKKSRDLCDKEGITNWHVSLSDEGDYGVAVVVLEIIPDHCFV